MRNKVLNLVKDFEACKLVCFPPSEMSEGVIVDLYVYGGTITGNVLPALDENFVDRRFRRRLGKIRQESPDLCVK